MKLQSFITNKSDTETRRHSDAERKVQLEYHIAAAPRRRVSVSTIFASLRLCAFAVILSFPIYAQKVAVIVPEKNEQSANFAERLEADLSQKLKILDGALSETAFRVEAYENPFNLTTKDAKTIGARIGCDYFLLVKAQNLRRSTFARAEFYESFAALYIVSARTGRLVFWKLASSEAETPAKADTQILASINDLSTEIIEKLKAAGKDELNEKRAKNIEELPPEDSPEAKNFRPPLPYKRIKPEYTALASLYLVEATIEIEIEVDADGKLLKTEIVRWAGFGLDESVTGAIRKMQWRAADRSGKPLPMRVLLRYNFKKVEK